MSRLRRRWKEPGFIVDGIQVVVAIVVAVVLALDMIGVFSSVPWLSSNLPGFTFIAVCTLIVSSFLERQFVLRQLREQMRSLPRKGIFLENRRAFGVRFEERLEHARQVDILGVSLVAVAANYGGFLRTKVCSGCKVRMLLADPGSPAPSSTAGEPRPGIHKKDIESSIEKLKPLLESGNAELRLTTVSPPFSLLMIDPKKLHGEVQVELFVHKLPSSDRPHFTLHQASDEPWYGFFRDQFELLWNDARLVGEHTG